MQRASWPNRTEEGIELSKLVSFARGIADHIRGRVSQGRPGSTTKAVTGMKLGQGRPMRLRGYEISPAYNNHTFEIAIAHVSAVSIRELKEAMAAIDHFAELFVIFDPKEMCAASLLQSRETRASGVAFYYHDDRIDCFLEVELSIYDHNVPSEDAMLSVLNPILTATNCTLREVRWVEGEFRQKVLSLTIDPPDDATILELAQLQFQIHRWPDLQTADTPIGILNAVLERRFERLIGLCESSHFDAKSKHYDRTDKNRIAFAQDVAAFANSPQGGVIVLGAQTARRAGQDVVNTVTGCERDAGAADAYRSIIDQLIAPHIRNVTLHEVEQAETGRHVFAIFIPPQPPGSMPHIVKGALLDNGKYTAALFSVPVRNDAKNGMLPLAEVQRLFGEFRP